MADRAAPMSSEEDTARDAIWELSSEMPTVWRGRNLPQDSAWEVDFEQRWNAAIETLTTAIERRVLAQQPGVVHLAHDARCTSCHSVAIWLARSQRARTARAAQTQETSG